MSLRMLTLKVKLGFLVRFEFRLTTSQTADQELLSADFTDFCLAVLASERIAMTVSGADIVVLVERFPSLSSVSSYAFQHLILKRERNTEVL